MKHSSLEVIPEQNDENDGVQEDASNEMETPAKPNDRVAVNVAASIKPPERTAPDIITLHNVLLRSVASYFSDLILVVFCCSDNTSLLFLVGQGQGKQGHHSIFPMRWEHLLFPSPTSRTAWWRS